MVVFCLLLCSLLVCVSAVVCHVKCLHTAKCGVSKRERRLDRLNLAPAVLRPKYKTDVFELNAYQHNMTSRCIESEEDVVRARWYVKCQGCWFEVLYMEAPVPECRPARSDRAAGRV